MCSELVLKKLGIRVRLYIYIYIWGIFVISGYRVFIWAEFRVGSRIFLIKPGPASGFYFYFYFYFLNSYPTLFLIRLCKTQPIRNGSDRVPVGRAKIAIPSYYYKIGKKKPYPLTCLF